VMALQWIVNDDEAVSDLELIVDLSLDQLLGIERSEISRLIPSDHIVVDVDLVERTEHLDGILSRSILLVLGIVAKWIAI